MTKQEPRAVNILPKPDLPIKPQRGAIVNIGSTTATTGFGFPSYAATKHAVIGITQNGAFLYGNKGIRVNAVSPGMTLTKMALANMEPEDREAFESEENHYIKPIALRTPARPEEQAAVISFLLSAESSHVTGMNIIVDGGWANTRSTEFRA